MPTIDQNRTVWNETYSWEKQGEEWSRVWGGAESQWFGAIYPRIHRFVPTGTILEIAPGFGRWTEFLRKYCEKLLVVDLSERCITHCKERFADCSHIDYHINDGRSLAMVPDRSVDFVFCFDSLVHAEEDVIAAYTSGLAAKLTQNGAGFIHHSNLRAFLGPDGQLPVNVDNTHWRAKSVSADFFRESCAKAGMACISQELVNWGCDILTDCFSVFTPKGSEWIRGNVILENPEFMIEAEHIARLSPLYSRNVQSQMTAQADR